jgi:hypothetical protein
LQYHFKEVISACKRFIVADITISHFPNLKHSLLSFAVVPHFTLQEKEARTKQVGETSIGIYVLLFYVKLSDID